MSEPVVRVGVMESRSRDAVAPLSVVTHRDQGRIVLVVTGEIDMSNAGVLEEAMVAALDQASTDITVDLSGVRFMDSSGIAALVNTHRRSALTSSTLSVVNCRPNVRQVMEITQVYDILTGPSTPHI